VQTTVPAIRRI